MDAEAVSCSMGSSGSGAAVDADWSLVVAAVVAVVVADEAWSMWSVVVVVVAVAVEEVA